MSIFKIENTEISALAACVPKTKVRTEEYDLISPSEQKQFVQGTGIQERRVADSNTCTSDMCFASASKIIDELKIEPSEIDVLIFVSQSPDYFLPATSIILQNRLGLSKSTMAFDINLGCSGYIYGLSVLSNLLSIPGMRRGLLLCGDKSTQSTNYLDKSTYPLFGDAGTATLLKRNDLAKPMYFNLQSDGSGKEAIIIRGGATRHPYDENTNVVQEIAPGISRCQRDLELDGVEVFNFSLREVKPNVVDLLSYACVEQDDIDYLVMHQANKLMNESVRKKLKFPVEKTPYSIGEFGNTSSASIPLTIVTELKDKLQAEKQLLLSGFGVGFSWGSVLMTTNSPHICDLIEL